MDPLNKPPDNPNPDSDAYIGLLLYKTGRSVKNALSAVGRVIAAGAGAVLAAVLFVFRNLLWLIVGTGVGFAYGAFTVSKQGTQYFSELTIKSNFNSTRSLYNSIDYFNALLARGQFQDLSKIFSITAKEAGGISGFSAEPVKSEMITAELYRDQFLQYDRTYKAKQDTFWLHTIDYAKFKETLTKFDYPYHVISVTSYDPVIFLKLQQGLVATISDNKLLQEIRQRQIVSNKEEEMLLTSAIKSIDTLRKAYNSRINRGESAVAPGNQITMVDNIPDVKIPELEVYDKMLELQDELKKSRKRSLTENEIVEVISAFPAVGKEVSILKQKTTRYALLGLILSFIIVVGVTFFKNIYLKKKSDLKA